MKIKIAVAAMTGMLFLTALGGIGCRKKENPAIGQKNVLFGTSSRFTATMSGGRFESFCDRGFLYEEERLLMFQEYESRNVYPLCSEAYCAHEPYSESNPKPTCEAAIPDVTAAAINGHELYVFCEQEFGKTTVLVRDLYESGYKEVAKLPYSMTLCVPGIYNLMKEDKAYLIMSDTGNFDVTGIIVQQEMPTVILELELKTGKYREVFRIQEGPQIRAMAEMQNGLGLYFLYGTTDVRFEEDGTPVLTPGDLYDTYYYVDFEVNSWKEISSLMPEGGLRKEDFEASDEKLVFVSFSEHGVNVKKGRKLYVMNPKTEELTLLWTLPEEYDSFSSGAGSDVLTMYVENSEGGKRGLFEVAAKTFHEADFGIMGIEYFGDGFFCCSYFQDNMTTKKFVHQQMLLDQNGECFFEWTR